MPLEFSHVAAQIEDMVAKAGQEGKEQRGRLERALDIFAGADTATLIAKTAACNTPWPVAGVGRGFNKQYDAPLCPEEFTVLATDGSHIDVDRHHSVRCSLINVGSIALHYGPSPDAELNSEAVVYFGDDLVLTGKSKNRTKLIEGTLLGVKRSIKEFSALADVALKQPSGQPVLAMVDGSLVLWGLSPEDYEGFVREEMLDKEYLKSFDIMKQRSGDGEFALCAYTSFPRNADVVNALRIYLCGCDPIDCDRCPADQRGCEDVDGITDGILFEALLDVGRRSATFKSGWKYVQDYYGEHQVSFFYLKVGDELARVEIPQWVAERSDMVGIVHSLVLDQCRRGMGYPVALMEAHEKAVVTASDRETFKLLVERAVLEQGADVRVSGKSRSKRTRWV